MEKYGFPDLERRRFPRSKDNIFVLCSLKASTPVEFKVVASDISAGGLIFETERDVSKDSELELQIYQPRNRDKNMIFSIPVLAKVAWIRKIEKDNFEKGENKYRIGIEFLEIKEKDRKIIANYLEKKHVK